MQLTQKESTLLKDLRSQEQLCIDKYAKYSNDACDGQLKELFSQIRQHEQQHLQTLDQIASGTVPQMQAQSGGSQQQPMQMQGGSQQQPMQAQSGSQQGMNAQQGGSQQNAQFKPSNCSAQEKQKDAYLCSDALSTEKHVSSTYNTCIFEFADSNVRNVLNHIQKEEQQHGDQIYKYMSANGMYS